MGGVIPVEKGTTQQEDTSDKIITESEYFLPETSPSEMSPAESKGLCNGELSDIQEPMTDSSVESKEGFMIDQEHFETSDPNEHVHIESDHVALEGSISLDTKVKTESIERQDLEISDTEVETLDNEDSTVSSESKSETPDRSEISSQVIAPVDLVTSETRGSGHLREYEAENINQENSSTEHSLVSEVMEGTDVKDIKMVQLDTGRGDKHSENACTPSDHLDASLTLQGTDPEDNTVVVGSDLDEQSEIEIKKFSPGLDENQVIITQQDFFSVTGEAVIAEGNEYHCHQNNKHELLSETMSKEESPGYIRETEVDQHSQEETLSSNVVAMEKKVDGQGVQAAPQPSINFDQKEGEDESVENSLGEVAVLQRVDAGEKFFSCIHLAFTLSYKSKTSISHQLSNFKFK